MPHPSSQASRRYFRPHLEMLEDRIVPSQGVFLIEEGTITEPKIQDSFPLTLNATEFTTVGGRVLVSLMAEAIPGSSLDPGLITVVAQQGTKQPTIITQLTDIGLDTTSLSLVYLIPGSYTVNVSSQKGTVGAYQLSATLAGDATGDCKVAADDISLIKSLQGTKRNQPGYLAGADVDANGVINGGDLQLASKNLGAATTLTPEGPVNPLDEFLLDPSALSLTGVDLTGFNPVSSALHFTLVGGGQFFQDPNEVNVTVNGAPLPANQLSISATSITATGALTEGKNEVFFTAVDVVGRPLYLTATVWTGSHTLTVNLVDETGQTITDLVEVVAKLGDDQSIMSQAATSTAQVIFQNIPDRTLLIQANASNGRFGLVGTTGAQGTVELRLTGIGTPSTIDNNDLALGTSGWNIGSAPVQVEPHVEGLPGQLTALSFNAENQAAAISSANLEVTARDAMIAGTFQSVANPQTGLGSGSFSLASIVDNDLVLNTAGEGEQSISRTFTTSQGTTAVEIRYRFITSEVPGGYFGTQYNDYFRVSLRSQLGGGFAGESNSMNGLGLAAFDFATGATAWRTATLQVNPQGDTIQVDAGVANVGDGALDSQVVIDFVKEVRDQVKPSLAWNNTQGGMDLTYSVENGQLADAVTISVYFANGTGYNNRLGGPVFTYTVQAGTPEGQYGPIHIDGNLLGNDPTGTTHLIAVASETSVGSRADVQIGYGASANAAVVSPALIDIIKDGLRAAGQATATITSTARTPADQARAMFQNLTNPNNTIAQNITIQQGIYAAPGEAVIGVFATMVQGLTLQQVLANQAAIRAAMEQEIIDQGPSNVSRHCAEPPGNVVDVAAGVFNATNGPLFVAAVQGRLTRYIDERNTNGCYHLEL